MCVFKVFFFKFFSKGMCDNTKHPTVEFALLIQGTFFINDLIYEFFLGKVLSIILYNNLYVFFKFF